MKDKYHYYIHEKGSARLNEKAREYMEPRLLEWGYTKVSHKEYKQHKRELDAKRSAIVIEGEPAK